MAVVNIFLTGDLGEASDDFVHNNNHYTFDRVTSGGPRRLIEGEAYFFIDWVTEDMAGLELCRRLRADERLADAHITMLLEDDDMEDRRRALKAGADDYIIGPIDRTMVLDRVLAAQTGVSAPSSADVIECGPLVISLTALQARWHDQPLAIRPNEFRLLRFFAENSDRVLSREDLIAGLGKSEPRIDERTVDVWVGRLRRAFKAAGAGEVLRTVRSMGYVFDTPSG